jgi:hypothetical protein
MQQIWRPETAELYELLQPEEKEQEDAAREARMETDIAASDTTEEDEEEANEGEETEDSGNEQEYKVDISKYSIFFGTHKTHSQDNKERTGRCQNCPTRNSMHCPGMEWSAIYKISPLNRQSTTCGMHYLLKEHQHIFRRS